MDSEQLMKLKGIRSEYPDKFSSEENIFSNIHRGDRIFIHTACGEPQYLVQALIKYVESHPKAFVDAEVFHVYTLGVAPYTDRKFKRNFRHNSFFIGKSSREAVNEGLADYTPIFLSEVPGLIYKKQVPLDVALIQVSPPDKHGFMSLGVSVDIVKAAVLNSNLVIAQVNSHMPRVHGDGFLHIRDVDYIIPYDEPILENISEPDTEKVQNIGKYIARLIQNGDTIQVGYGGIPNAVMANLKDKKDLGVHTELISDGLVELMKLGVVNNKLKTINVGKTVCSFCMGRTSTYEYINDNPAIDFRTIDYTNNPRIIAQHDNMVAINSVLEIDLTGQATAESIGKVFFSGIGGQADFMRGSVLARNGKSILALKSTSKNDTISRIVPSLQEGAGVTLNRGDIHYVVTEYGIAYLHGKNIRERSMELISIAHPKFRGWLIQEAKKLNIIFKDQAFIPGKKGEYPEELENYRTTSKGKEIFMRPVKISDEPLLKDFFYSLSDNTMYKRFISFRSDMPHERLQDFVIIDYTKEMEIVVMEGDDENENIIGLGQYAIDENTHTAEVAFIVRDDYQNLGIGTVLLDYLVLLAKKQGLLGLTAEVLMDNKPMLHLFEKFGFSKRISAMGSDTYELHLPFTQEGPK